MSDTSTRTRPLEGKRVLVTRTREQAGALSEQLRQAGAEPIELPVIRIVPPASWQPLDQALRALAGGNAYDWLIFTSANGVRMVLERVRELGLAPALLRGPRIATIGPATAAALAIAGLSADLVPAEFIAESVVQALRDEVARQGTTLAGQRILLARAAEARQVLVSELQAEGAQIQVVAAYQTVPVAHDDESGQEVIRLLHQQRLDALTFTSSSTVHHFMHWLGQAAPDIATLLAHPGKQPDRPAIVCIGPVTARTAREYGLQVSVEAREFTAAGLVEAFITYEER